MHNYDELKRSKAWICASIFLAFFIVAIPVYFTPRISDDFFFLSSDFSVEFFVTRYFNWSGHLVNMFTNMVILRMPDLIRTVIHSGVWIASIFMISVLPSVYVKGQIEFSHGTFWTIFILYWIGNPHLGETSFWTVGAVAYLFSNFWILLYLLLILYMRKQPAKKNLYFLIPILGLFAGNSNENTSVIIVILSCFFLFTEANKKTYLLGTVSTLMGTLVLLLAPGQRVRAMHPSFQLGREMSIFQRGFHYITTDTFMQTFTRYQWLFIAFAIFAIVGYRNKAVDVEQKKMMLVFFFAGVLANMAFAVSPVLSVTTRALNGALFFFLISISFFIEDYDWRFRVNSKKNYSFLIILIFLIPFTIGYTFLTRSVYIARRQHVVRASMIKSGIEDEREVILIPNLYLGRLYRPGDAIDLFHAGRIGWYYGAHAPVELFNPQVTFDYSNHRLLEQRQHEINQYFGVETILEVINFFPDTRNLNQWSMNLFFDGDITVEYSWEKRLFAHIYWAREAVPDGSVLHRETPLSQQLYVNGKNFISIPMEFVRPRDISHVQVGIINIETGEIYAEIEVRFD